MGTTSAYAENTSGNHCGQALPGNYLRVRGEYFPAPRAIAGAVELPPRTRRIPVSFNPNVIKHGTTSAYAENTPGPGRSEHKSWNYLRVRGEYRANVIKQRGVYGTTSAYAENTLLLISLSYPVGNYLRVRGEYKPFIETHIIHGELPPRTRRILE